MRVAVFSDLHAVLPAWNTFLKSSQAQGVEAYWCLGDVVGYGPYPIETLQAVRDLIEQHSANLYILGNHDAIATGLLPTGRIHGTEMTRSGVNVEAEDLTLSHQFRLKQGAPNLLEWLGSQAKSQANPYPGVYLAHGAYIDPVKQDMGKYPHAGRWEYATKSAPDAALQVRRIDQWYGEGSTRLALYGHYHVPTLFRASPKTLKSQQNDLHWNEWITLDGLADSPALINVGSLALPRKAPDDPTQVHSSYLLLDLPDQPEQMPLSSVKVCFCTNPYDWRTMVRNTTLFHDIYIMRDEVLRQIQNSSLPEGISNP